MESDEEFQGPKRLTELAEDETFFMMMEHMVSLMSPEERALFDNDKYEATYG